MGSPCSALISVSPANAATVFQPPSDLSTAPYCSAQISRGVHWNWTRSGEMAIRPCPEGATGLARWQCSNDEDDAEADDGVSWQTPQPDLGDCKSAEMTQLEVRVRQEDPEDVIASRLATLTRSHVAARLFGGDLESAVNVLRSVANRLQYKLQQGAAIYNKRSHVLQIYQNVLRSASQLLSPSLRVVWADLRNEGERAKTAALLMTAVEANADVMAEVLEDEDDAEETLWERSKEIGE